MAIHNIAFHAVVKGRVQGVGFRYACFNEAKRLGISGWVRNEPDGSVEVLAEGSSEKTALFLKWLRRGPPGARVSSVSCEEQAAGGAGRGFNIL